jgi:ribose/xylose/arabinose/galactoside ABC-type transport system permease subunit
LGISANAASLAIAIAGLSAALAGTTTAFANAGNLAAVASEASLWLVLSLASAAVILAGGIDISIGALAALSAGAAAAAMKAPLPNALIVPVGVVAGLIVGIAGGALNAALSLVGRVQPIVVTLGMLTVYRGMLRLLFSTGGWTMLDSPRGFRDLALARPFAMEGSMLFAVASAVVCHLWLTRTVSGRRLFAHGSSPTAARLAGISRSIVWLTAFGVGGALAAVAGMLELARNGSMQATLGEGYELRAITAAVVGGVAVTGGRGGVLGVALGTLLLSLIRNALIVWGVPGVYYDLVSGSLLLAAVAVDAVARRSRS